MATKFLSPCDAEIVAPGSGRPPNLTWPWTSAAQRGSAFSHRTKQRSADKMLRVCLCRWLFMHSSTVEMQLGSCLRVYVFRRLAVPSIKYGYPFDAPPRVSLALSLNF